MNVLRMIKMFGWERKIQSRIDEKREEELKWIWKARVSPCDRSWKSPGLLMHNAGYRPAHEACQVCLYITEALRVF